MLSGDVKFVHQKEVPCTDDKYMQGANMDFLSPTFPGASNTVVHFLEEHIPPSSQDPNRMPNPAK